MKLKEWRLSQKLTQMNLVVRLQDYADINFPDEKHILKQTTVSAWEKGTLPRKYWLQVLTAFTKNKVCANDFI